LWGNIRGNILQNRTSGLLWPIAGQPSDCRAMKENSARRAGE
jgi:hypothetical protein